MPHFVRPVLTFALAAALTLLPPFLPFASLHPLASSRLAAQEITWEPWVLDVGNERHEAEMGHLTVPEVRGTPAGAEGGSGSVILAFVRLASRSDEPGPPIVYLDGGPGGKGVGIAQVPAYWRLFDSLRDVADVILLSQRGTGLSAPQFVCGLSGPLPTDVFTTRDRMMEVLEPEVESCAGSWRERGVDLSGYTTLESADDLESLRRALGAERLNLLAFSYGTHLALATLRRHPQRIHRAVLIGTEGLAATYKLPSTLDAQLHHLAARVARDPEGAAATPDLAAAIDSLLARLSWES
ncbi:MAG: alpha/beta fold hydrolase [Gemmatimonadota bacterium]